MIQYSVGKKLLGAALRLGGLALSGLLFIAVAAPSLSAGQDKRDFSGTWVRETSVGGFALLSSAIGRVALGAATWEQFAEGVRTTRPYTVVIKQTPEAWTSDSPLHPDS